jgi:glycine cleavage system pyridoxal-binding protein P
MKSEQGLDEIALICGLDVETANSMVHSEETRISESALTRKLQERSSQDLISLNFLAAGAFSYFIPAANNSQAQHSASFPPSFKNRLKGSIEQYLQQLTSFAVCTLTNDDVVSVLSKLVSSVCRAGHISTSGINKSVVLPATMLPLMRDALRTQLKFFSIDIVIMDYDKQSGCITRMQLESFYTKNIGAIVLPWPNLFGMLEDLESIIEWAAANEVKVISVVNSLLLFYLKSPASLYKKGIDYIVGDCQALGLPLFSYGVSPVFVASAEALDGIKLADFSGHNDSNKLSLIHTFLSKIDSRQIARSIETGRNNLSKLLQRIIDIPGVSVRFVSPWVNECVIQIDQIDLDKAIKILAGHKDTVCMMPTRNLRIAC